jgi:hypothetical protein
MHLSGRQACPKCGASQQHTEFPTPKKPPPAVQGAEDNPEHYSAGIWLSVLIALIPVPLALVGPNLGLHTNILLTVTGVCAVVAGIGFLGQVQQLGLRLLLGLLLAVPIFFTVVVLMLFAACGSGERFAP